MTQPFNGLGLGMGNLARLSRAKSRSISAENLTGAKGPPMAASHALFEAKAYLRALRDGDGPPLFEHPAYWAGWTLLGTGQ